MDKIKIPTSYRFLYRIEIGISFKLAPAARAKGGYLADLEAVEPASLAFVDVSLVWKKDAYSMQGMKCFREFIREKELFAQI